MSGARSGSQRLIILSNRLPVVATREESGDWRLEPGAGGLVTALAPVLRDRGGTWIGWAGAVTEEGPPLDDLLLAASRKSGHALRAVAMSAEERDQFYRGFANEVIWPLFHDLQSRCRFDPAYWQSYVAVNRRYAEVVSAVARRGDLVWVHDYHLMSVAHCLRSAGFAGRLAFFLHIPFPPLDIFLKLPWRREILRDLLAHDLVGFQTLRDRRNFIQCVRRLGAGQTLAGRGQLVTVAAAGREVRLGAFPIGVDFRAFDRLAARPDVVAAAAAIRARHPGRQLLLGVDRLDYTKGVPERLLAFEYALRAHPELQGKVVLMQLMVPSRGEIRQYSDLRAEIEGLVGRINGQFTRHDWQPVRYMYRALRRADLVAMYRAADVLLITPWKDGMNLVAKEYCACRSDEGGVLLLSEFAGAAAQLHRPALLVNPHDIAGMGEAIRRAAEMPPAERRERMRRLRLSVRRHDVFWWVDAFLQAWHNARLDNFPVLEDFVPGPPEGEEPVGPPAF